MSAVLSGYREKNHIVVKVRGRSSPCTQDNQIEALIILMLIKDVDNGGMLATFGFLYPVEPPYATASRKRPPPIRDHLSKTPKISQSKPYGWKLS